MKNIDELINFLPKDYEEKAYELEVFTRSRKIRSPKELMYYLLVSLVIGLSLKLLVTFKSDKNLLDISSVGIMKRLNNCAPLIEYINKNMATTHIVRFKLQKWMEKYEVRAVDASSIAGKGSNKDIWKVHYMIDLKTMTTTEYLCTNEKTGEKLTNFTIKNGDLILADRAYGTKQGIEYVIESGADFIIRLKNNPFKIYDENGNEINLCDLLKKVKKGVKIKDFTIYMKHSKTSEFVKLRLCVMKKLKKDIEKSVKKYDNDCIKEKRTPNKETRETHKYILLVTTITSEVATTIEILEVYRYRWQIELVFKRLKSIMELDKLSKKSENSVMAWINRQTYGCFNIRKNAW